MRALWILAAGFGICCPASAAVRCIATCEYYTSSYSESDSAFIELTTINLENSRCAEVAKYRVPVVSAGETESEARSALNNECLKAADYVSEYYKARTYDPHLFEIHYCG